MNKELIEQHRHINVDYDDWHSHIQDDFVRQMEEIGVEAERIYFSGFWSQGDGAMFEGRVRDWGKFLTHMGYVDDNILHDASDFWDLSWKHSGHYYHDHCVSWCEDIYAPECPYENQLKQDAWDATLAQYDFVSMEQEFKEKLRSHMRSLYRQLEDSYDYLTSDEAVWETLKANDMTTLKAA